MMSFPYEKPTLSWTQARRTNLWASTDWLIYLQNLIAGPEPAISGCCPFFVNFMDHYGVLREEEGGVNPPSQIPHRPAAMTHPTQPTAFAQHSVSG